MIRINVQQNCWLFIDYCKRSNINISNIEYKSTYLLLDIEENNLDDNIIDYYNIQIIKYYGIKGVIVFIKNYMFDIILFILINIIIFFTSTFIVSVDIKVSNKSILNEVKNILDNSDLDKFNFVKSNLELKQITSKILKEYPKYDLFSVERIGMHYNILVEYKKNTPIIESGAFCHVIAKRDGVINSIHTINGDPVGYRNKLVKKGEILISGRVLYGDHYVDKCARGKILANTWYKVSIKVPLKKQERVKTGKWKTNFIFNDKYVIKNNYSEYDEKVYFKIKGFKIVKDIEYKYRDIYLTEEEAVKEGLKLAKKRLLASFNKKITINNEKVLKVNEKDSKIIIDIFYSITEDIGYSLEYTKEDMESDLDDTN